LAIVLSRPKFKTSPEEIKQLTKALSKTADVIEVETKIRVVKDDPKDDMVIGTALDGEAQMIVTGDNHLLALGAFRGIKIVTIEKMLACLNADT